MFLWCMWLKLGIFSLKNINSFTVYFFTTDWYKTIWNCSSAAKFNNYFQTHMLLVDKACACRWKAAPSLLQSDTKTSHFLSFCFALCLIYTENFKWQGYIVICILAYFLYVFFSWVALEFCPYLTLFVEAVPQIIVCSVFTTEGQALKNQTQTREHFRSNLK